MRYLTFKQLNSLEQKDLLVPLFGLLFPLFLLSHASDLIQASHFLLSHASGLIQASHFLLSHASDLIQASHFLLFTCYYHLNGTEGINTPVFPVFPVVDPL